MNSKALLVVDARIAKIRDDIAGGRVKVEAVFELNDLVEKRLAIPCKRNTRQSYSPIAPESDRALRA